MQVILLVEDNVRYYSSFLPVMYTELLHHSQRVIKEGLNLSQQDPAHAGAAEDPAVHDVGGGRGRLRHLRRRRARHHLRRRVPAGRPQVTRRPGPTSRAHVRGAFPDVPIVLHSSRPENEALARSLGADFLLKGSPLLLQELRDVMLDHFGFGDFVFRTARRHRGRPRAPTCAASRRSWRPCPRSRIVHHAGRNHFSRWLKARTEFALAHELRPRAAHRLRGRRGAAREPHPRDRRVPARPGPRRSSRTSTATTSTSPATSTAWAAARSAARRAASRSCGACSRSRACATASRASRSRCRSSAVARDGRLRPLPGRQRPALVRDRVRGRRRDPGAGSPAAPFPRGGRAGRGGVPGARRLAARRALVEPPRGLAAPAVHRRLRHADARQQLAGATASARTSRSAAIKRVYASTFSQHAKGYLTGDALPARGGEDGGDPAADRRARRAGRRFYPDFSGVARSHNFYPSPPMSAERRDRGGGARHGPGDRRGRRLPALLPALPAATSCSSRRVDGRAATRRSASSGRCRSRAATRDGRMREERFDLADGRGRRHARRPRLHVLARERRRLRRPRRARARGSSPSRRILKHGLFPLAEILDTLMAGRRAGDGHAGRDRVRREPRARAAASAASSASCRCGRSR